MKRFFMVLVLGVTVALAAACGGGSKDGAATPPTAVETAALAPIEATLAPEPTAVPVEPTVAPLETQKQIGDLLLTVNGASLYNDELFPADPGTHYVAVDITAQNTGKKTYSLNVFNFHLKDSDKYASEKALVGGPEPLIGAVDMVPGQEVRGFIVFKLGDGRSPMELQYQSFTGSTGTIPVVLGQ